MIIGYYYLHTNGALIYKKDLGDIVADFRESPFVRAFWPIDPENRKYAWNLLVEASASGANPDRIKELAEKWNCDDKDAAKYAEVIGIRLYLDGDAWCATRMDFVDLQQSPAGFGDTCLSAMIELCKAVGYKPHKMWGKSFEDHVKVQTEEKVDGPEKING